MRFIIWIATAVAWLVILTVVGLATDSAAAGLITATTLLALFVLVRWQGFTHLVARIRNSNLLDERPATQERERKADTGLRE